MNALLSQNPAIAAHIPHTETCRWSRLVRELDAGTSLILKPRIGSVGQGIVRIEPQGGRSARLTAKRASTLSYKALRKALKTRINSGRYLMQHYLKLARYEERPFDLRVPVQRDESGEWTVPGMVAKVAGKHPFLTNL